MNAVSTFWLHSQSHRIKHSRKWGMAAAASIHPRAVAAATGNNPIRAETLPLSRVFISTPSMLRPGCPCRCRSGSARGLQRRGVRRVLENGYGLWPSSRLRLHALATSANDDPHERCSVLNAEAMAPRTSTSVSLVKAARGTPPIPNGRLRAFGVANMFSTPSSVGQGRVPTAPHSSHLREERVTGLLDQQRQFGNDR